MHLGLQICAAQHAPRSPPTTPAPPSLPLLAAQAGGSLAPAKLTAVVRAALSGMGDDSDEDSDDSDDGGGGGSGGGGEASSALEQLELCRPGKLATLSLSLGAARLRIPPEALPLTTIRTHARTRSAHSQCAAARACQTSASRRLPDPALPHPA